jgi:outer membrane protein assembly factor BamB
MTLRNIFNRPVAAGCTVGLILLAGVMYPQSAPLAPRAVTDRELLEPDPADWLMWRRTLNSWGYSPLNYRETPAQETSGPIIANGKIFSTRGCEFKFSPDGCIITAHDAKTGKELWRRRTIPKPGEPGDESWGGIPDQERRHVGAWMVPSYDAEFNLLYVGTSVTSPAPKFLLAGNDKEYLYHNSTLAIDGDTGRIVWYYQHVVDHWDFDHPFERLLVDTAVAPDAAEVTWINPRLRPGERRKVITGIPGKTGIVYTLDRQTGEFLWARPTVRQNVVAKIDGATGKVTVNPETTFSAVGETHFICPSASGGKDFQAGAYSPMINAMYYGLQNICANQLRSTKARCMPSTHGPRSCPVPRTSERCLRFPRRPARLFGATTSVRA